MVGEDGSAGSGIAMRDKLESWYKKVSADVGRGGLGNGGHRIGFYGGVVEPINPEYEFDKGTFTLWRFDGGFCWWDYTPAGEKTL